MFGGLSVSISFKRVSDGERSASRAAQQDIFTGAVVVAAIIMFVGTGTSALGSFVDMVSGVGGGVNNTLTITLILNIALILFGWRRYRDLAHEVEERKAAEERANMLALRDPLTGFHNRRALAEQGADLLGKSLKREKALAMMMLDLDHFKNVNDVHGHAAGDALLRAVAAEIAKFMPPNALAARLGGDEFACAFPFDIGSKDTVDRVAEGLIAVRCRRHVRPYFGIAWHCAQCRRLRNDRCADASR
jgi:GGDEF domain-containing protein